MRPRGGNRGDRHRQGRAFLLHLLAASSWLYGALLVLYPEAFRHRYEAEMRSDFRELSREGLQEGGSTELMRVWLQAFSDLVLTALKERSTLLAARSAYSLAVDPRIAVRAMVVAVVLVAVAVTLASSTRTPTYEASAQVWVDQKQGDQQTNLAGTVEGLQTIILTMIHAIDSRPVAEEAIRRLGLRMEPDELLDNLTFEQVKSTNFIRITYEGNDPVEATKIVNTVGEVSSEFISERSAAGSNITATVYDKAIVPESPVSPHPLSNGLLTLVIGLMLCAGLALALPVVAASVAGKLGRQAVLQGVGQAGVPAVTRTGRSEAEGIKEKELLQALGRAPSRKLTVTGAALETSLSVGEAERMLEALAAKGHLQVTVEHGRLHYSLWEPDVHL
jgi:capsular polysaccharide biosynthesis protein